MTYIIKMHTYFSKFTQTLPFIPVQSNANLLSLSTNNKNAHPAKNFIFIVYE